MLLKLLNKKCKHQTINKNLIDMSDKKCIKCGLPQKKNDFLMRCNVVGCFEYIHDNCASPQNLLEEQEITNYYCDLHIQQRNQQVENVPPQNANNEENSIVDVDQTNVAPPSSSPPKKEIEVSIRNAAEKGNGTQQGQGSLKLDTSKNHPSQQSNNNNIEENLNNVNTRRGSTKDVKELCAICKKEQSGSSAIIIKCFCCKQFFHDTCLRNFGEFELDGSICVCPRCEYGSFRGSQPSSISNSKPKGQGWQEYPQRNSYNRASTPNQPQQGYERKDNNNGFRNNNYDRNRNPNNDYRNRNDANYRNNNNNNSNFRQDNNQRRSYVPEVFIEKTDPVEAVMNMINKTNTKELPRVYNEMGWEAFYLSYLDTAKYFTLSENHNRVRDALKDKNILKKGGIGLDNLHSFESAMENINRRMKKNQSYLIGPANELRNARPPAPEDSAKVVDLMEKILDFVNMANKYHDKNYWNNREFITEITQKLPHGVHTRWIRKTIDIKKKNRSPNLGDLGNCLNLELEVQEEFVAEQRLFKGKPSGNKQEKVVEQKKNKSEGNDENWIHNTTEEESCYHKVNQDVANLKYCWLHKSNEHNYSSCKDLWNMDGKEVHEMALKKERCTICGQRKHTFCPAVKMLKCKTCGQEHHALFCIHRKGNATTKDSYHTLADLLNKEDYGDNDGETEK